MQRFQSKIICSITNTPNFILHNDLKIPFISEETKTLSVLYFELIDGHANELVDSESYGPKDRDAQHDLTEPNVPLCTIYSLQ